MDPDGLDRVKEVIFLHSLWRAGPPRSVNHGVNTVHSQSNRHSFPPSAKITKTKTNNFEKKKKKKPQNKNLHESKASVVLEKPWPCEDPVICRSSSPSHWPAFETNSSSPAPLPSAEELAAQKSKNVQKSALKAWLQFLAGNSDSDSDCENDYEDDDSFSDDTDDAEQSEEFKFLLKLFTDDAELRDFYEKNIENGEFYCLACSRVDRMYAKMFTGCLALLQHSISISKTKRRSAHRAYGRVICKVIGWNINRLPTILQSLDDPLGLGLAKSKEEEEKNSEDDEEKKHMGGGVQMNSSDESATDDGLEDLDESDSSFSL